MRDPLALRRVWNDAGKNDMHPNESHAVQCHCLASKCSPKTSCRQI